MGVARTLVGMGPHKSPSGLSPGCDLAWVIVIGVAFIGIFTSWFSTQSFAVKLLNSGGVNLGSWLLGIVYVCFIISNQIAPSVVGAIGAKWAMVVGSVGYLLGTAGAASQNAALTLVGAACVGFGAGLLWSGQGRMLTDLSDDSTRGLSWGIFDALMMGGSGLVANSITINFAPEHQTNAGGGSGSGSDDATPSDAAHFNKEVHSYFMILCIPVGLAILVLMCIPNLPKPTEKLSLSGAFLQSSPTPSPPNWNGQQDASRIDSGAHCGGHIGATRSPRS